MDWRAANGQQQEALWRVFLMFIIMALLIIRTGLVPRLATPENASQDAEPAARNQPTMTPSDLYRATLRVLRVAEAAGRLFILKTRTIWELMNQPLPQPASKRPLYAGSLCEPPRQRLDTS